MADNKIGKAEQGINTRLAHTGNNPSDFHGFVNPPVVHASTVLFPNARTMETRAQKYTYGTRGTPTTDALCEAVNELEGAAGTILVPSGLAAVTVPFLAYLSSGDHVLIVDSVYFPTRHFCDTMLSRLGVTVEYYDPTIGAGIENLIRPNTRLVHTEAPGSNTFEMQDIPAIAAAAHRHGCIVTMDNTWATPVYFRPPRPRRRRVDPCGDQVPFRSLGRSSRNRFGQCGPLAGTQRGDGHARRLRFAGRQLSDPARPAHDGRSPGASSGKRARDR